MFIIGMSVYASEMSDFLDQQKGYSFGWAYGLGWAAFFLAVAAGIVEALEECLNNMFQTQDASQNKNTMPPSGTTCESPE